MKGTIDAKYVWTEHVSPTGNPEVKHIAENAAPPQVEEFVSPEVRKVSLTEVQDKNDHVSAQAENARSESITSQNRENNSTTSGESLIEIMANLDNNDLKLKMHYLTPEAAAEKVIAKMVDISTLTKKQSEYISYNTQKYASELTRLIAQYKEEKAQTVASLKELHEERANSKTQTEKIVTQYQEETAQAIEKLAAEQQERFKLVTELKYLQNQYNDEKNQVLAQLTAAQQERDSVDEEHKICLHRLEKLESILRNQDNSTGALEAKAQQFAKQIEKLENILKTEQVLRKQAEERTKEILVKAKKIKAINENERKQREAAELQAQKAIIRAREVMSYFFNSAFTDDGAAKNSAANFINKNFPEFDSVMMNKKSMI